MDINGFLTTRHSTDPIGFALVLALTIHAFLLFSISFDVSRERPPAPERTLDITLVQPKPKPKPIEKPKPKQEAKKKPLPKKKIPPKVVRKVKPEKPKVDAIIGLSPAIAIEQKSASNNPRSTVGTITEIYDYLRLLFARVGEVLELPETQLDAFLALTSSGPAFVALVAEAMADGAVAAGLFAGG